MTTTNVRPSKPRVASETDIQNALAGGQISFTVAERLIRSRASAADLKREIDDVQRATAAAAAISRLERKMPAAERRQVIEAMCRIVHAPEDVTQSFVNTAGLSLATIREHLCIIPAWRDNIEIDGTILDTGAAGARPKLPKLSPADIYRERNATPGVTNNR